MRDTTGTNGSSTVVVGCAHVVRRETLSHECVHVYVCTYTGTHLMIVFLKIHGVCACAYSCTGTKCNGDQQCMNVFLLFDTIDDTTPDLYHYCCSTSLHKLHK